MRLKRVRIFGFKTFADRTEFGLDGGVVAVVGPNGCGKSNLVDAVLWGLGEGNSRQLRAQSGQDVIFSGSSRRKPVGFAEVSLLFDNEDGALPIETSEVSLTRRLTRSGESEYHINRQPCRLRDFHDLLADSGLGRAGYAIVGQKEIDAALSASAEDRRAWIDEAAGVQRYRSRKVESLRRLGAANEHLSRIADIIQELTAQREPLREDAELAIQYKGLMAALREVELGLLVHEVGNAVREVSSAEARIAECHKISRRESQLADDLDKKAERLSQALSALETNMESVRAFRQESLTQIERLHGSIRLLEARLVSLDELESALAQKDAEGAPSTRLDESLRELELARADRDSDRQEFETLRSELAGVGEEARLLSQRLRDLEVELRDARVLESQRQRDAAERAHRRERLAAALRERQGIDASLPDLEEANRESEVAVEVEDAKLLQLRTEIGELEQGLDAIRKEEDADAKNVRASLSERASLEGRRRGIEATLLAHEGVSQGARAVLEAQERGLLRGQYTPVAEAIETDAELALAIETALGASANDLIVDDEADAKDAISWLKEHRAGRATFQPIPLMRPSDLGDDAKRILMERGVRGRASELVSCANRLRPVIDSLLGRVIIVEDIDVALRLARTSGWSRMVTVDGEVVHHSGAVTGGRQAKAGYGLVQRKADVAALEKEIATLDRVVKQFDARQSARAKSQSALRDRLETARKSLAEASTDLNEARNFHRTLADELKSTLRARERLDQEILKLSADAPVPTEGPKVSEIESKRDALLVEVASRSADAESAAQRLRESELRTEKSEIRLQAAERRRQIALDSEAERLRRLQTLGPERDRAHASIRETRDQVLAESEKQALADLALERLAAERRDVQAEVAKSAEQAKAARANVVSVSDASHHAELTRARAEGRRATALQKLIEDYGLTEDDALAEEARQLKESPLPPDANSVLARLRREIRALGEVNLGAIDAFERLSERLSELTQQQDDILAGIAQVEAGIAELDNITRERFTTTFAMVQSAFTEIFHDLFGGDGTGAMRLSDPARILETGIELDIQLPGKRRQPLNLLSGGERALCASAFLFALLRVKPSPLVVLDEVDAPLDGRNVERFSEMLHRFSDQTQFIVITHNMSTIVGADDWLGVTMQEPGISTLLPVRMPTAEAI